MTTEQRGVKQVYWGLLLGLIGSFVSALALNLALRKMYSASYDYSGESPFRLYEKIGPAMSLLQIAALGLIIGGLHRISRPAQVLFALLIANQVLWLYLPSSEPQDGDLLFWWIQNGWKITWPLAVLATLALGVGLLSLARRLGVRVPPWLLALLALDILFDILYPLYANYWGPRGPESMTLRWARIFVNSGLELPWLLACLGLARASTAGLPAAIAEGDSGAREQLHGEAWRAAASGLGTYTGAVKAKLATLIIAVVLLFLAISGKSVGVVKGVAVIWPLVDIITSFVLIAGLIGWAQLPKDSGGKTAAVIAMIAAMLVLATQLYGFSLVITLTGSPDDYGYGSSHLEKMIAAQKKLPYVEGAAQLGGLAAIIALLSSLRSVAQRIHETRLANRAGGLTVAVITLMTAAFWLRLMIADRQVKSVGSLLLFGLPVLVGAIAVIVSYLGLLERLRQQLSAQLAPFTPSPPPPTP